MPEEVQGKIIVVGGFEFEPGTIYQYKVPQRQNLPSDLVLEVKELMHKAKFPELPDDWQWDWFLQARECNHKIAGALPKRISNYLYKHHKFAVDPKVMSRMGQIIAASLKEEDTIYFDLDQTCDWRAGYFGESSHSCYWGSSVGSRYLVRDLGGGAIRVFNGNTPPSGGKARCWFIPVKHYNQTLLILFNNYGAELFSLARMLATVSGLNYRKCELVDPNRVLYINDQPNYIVGPAGLPESVSISSVYDANEYRHSNTCRVCGKKYPIKYMYDKYAYICINCK